MRILYLHQYFNTPAMRGGTRSYEFATRLADRGHAVHVITSRRDGKKSRTEEVRPGLIVEWISVPYSMELSNLRRIGAFLSFAARASHRACRGDFDVVFATSTPLTVALPALARKLLRRTPYVFEVRDLWPTVPIAMGALRSRIAQLLAHGLEWVAYRGASAVVALSPDMAIGVQGVSQTKVHVIPNSCDPAFSEDEVEPFDFGTRRRVVLYAGSLGRVNGPDYLVDLGVALVDTNIALALVGEGSERTVVEDRLALSPACGVSVILMRGVEKQEMPSLFRGASAGISTVAPIPALNANSANKVFDTLAAGLPIFINHGGWQKDMIEAAGAGLVLSRDVQVARREIEDFFADDEAVKEAMRAATRLARGPYSRERHVCQLERILADSVSGVRPGSKGPSR